MTTYVRATWKQRVLPPAALAMVLLATGVAVHQNASARSWRDLERTRAATAQGQLTDLRAELSELRDRAEAAEGDLAELANDDAQAGDVTAQLGVLAGRAAETEQALAQCSVTVSMDGTCGQSLLEARALLRALQRLESR